MSVETNDKDDESVDENGSGYETATRTGSSSRWRRILVPELKGTDVEFPQNVAGVGIGDTFEMWIA
jgi:hypothetical protein